MSAAAKSQTSTESTSIQIEEKSIRQGRNSAFAPGSASALLSIISVLADYFRFGGGDGHLL